jgi:hypothetical protein
MWYENPYYLGPEYILLGPMNQDICVHVLHILKRALRHLPPSCENANESWPSAPYEGITLGQDMPS